MANYLVVYLVAYASQQIRLVRALTRPFSIEASVTRVGALFYLYILFLGHGLETMQNEDSEQGKLCLNAPL